MAATPIFNLFQKARFWPPPDFIPFTSAVTLASDSVKKMYLFILAVALLSSTVLTRSLGGVLSNVEPMDSWHNLIRPYIPELVEIADNNVVTILVPSNGAVSKFTSSPAYAQMEPNSMRQLVMYHTLRGKHRSEDIVAAGPFLTTFLNEPGLSGGQRLEIVGGISTASRDPDQITFYSGMGDSSSIESYGRDFDADGTTLQLIDTVLTVPSTMFETALTAGLTSFAGAVATANMDLDSITDGTFFVPTNNAFETVGSDMNAASRSELTDILEYHYLEDTSGPLYTSNVDSMRKETAGGKKVTLSYNSGNALFVNTAAVIHANILVQNGVVHIVDQVLNPSSNTSAMDQPAGSIGLPMFPNATRANDPPFANVVADASVPSGVALGSGPVQTPLGSLAPGYQAQRMTTESNGAVSAKGGLVAVVIAAIGCAFVTL